MVDIHFHGNARQKLDTSVIYTEQNLRSHEMQLYHNCLSCLLCWVTTSLYRLAVNLFRHRRLPAYKITQPQVTLTTDDSKILTHSILIRCCTA